MRRRVQILVMAKSPVPGSVKTRLCPPYALDEAARLAAAALEDTLAAVAATASSRPNPRPVRTHRPAPGRNRGGCATRRRCGRAVVECVRRHGSPRTLEPSRGDGHAAAHTTPARARDRDAVHPRDGRSSGPCRRWRLVVPGAEGSECRTGPGGCPHVDPQTFSKTMSALRSTGLRVQLAPKLTDVDTADDAAAVALAAPRSRFAHAVAEVGVGHAASAREVSAARLYSLGFRAVRAGQDHGLRGAAAIRPGRRQCRHRR